MIADQVAGLGTEAAAVAVGYAFIIGFFVLRTLKIGDIPDLLYQTGKTTGVVFLIIGSASILGWILTMERVPEAVAAGFLRVSNNPQIIDWLKGLAKAGDAEAMLLLGNLHARGVGTSQNFRRAVSWYKDAVKVSPDAQSTPNNAPIYPAEISEISSIWLACMRTKRPTFTFRPVRTFTTVSPLASFPW